MWRAGAPAVAFGFVSLSQAIAAAAVLKSQAMEKAT